MLKKQQCIVSLSLNLGGGVSCAPSVVYERENAVREILDENSFDPAGDIVGPYDVEISIQDGRLMIAVSGADGDELPALVMSLRPYRRVIKDYFMIVASYEQARADGNLSKLEAIDMGRRGVHDEGAELVISTLSGKIEIDFMTARRFFTLICVLHFGQARAPVGV